MSLRRILAAAAICALSVLPAGAEVAAPPVPPPPVTPVLPLAGRIVVIDPGHQLGNFTHSRQIARKVNAGGLVKPCNTTGTATRSGYRESAFTMSVANHLKARLTAQGATVHLTRSRESTRLWGPCVDVRGRFANKVHADLLVSIHADGTAERFRGFFVIRPAYKKGLTDDIYRTSGVLARHLRGGLDKTAVKRANYLGGDGLDTRRDMGTLNLSNAPAVMVELGNMKNASDARRMRSARQRDTVYAAGLARGVTSFLTR